MLYEMIGIVRPGKLNEVKEIAKSAGTIILNAGGVVRGVTNWGVFQLPRPTRKHQMTHSSGHHFILRFDASSHAQHQLRRTMSLDPRLIRYTMVKLGDSLADIADVPGSAPWGSGLSAVSSDPVSYAGLTAARPNKFGEMQIKQERKEAEVLKNLGTGFRRGQPTSSSAQ
ncbi:ribosomal protein S6 [Phyllosticta citrichinensis]|uniref:Ribosomal protein S6 n=1 Tax=Phyllosticta citrichinensis TaxID=1130410 RepID=A0ABR1XJW3_9PEZI